MVVTIKATALNTLARSEHINCIPNLFFRRAVKRLPQSNYFVPKPPISMAWRRTCFGVSELKQPVFSTAYCLGHWVKRSSTKTSSGQRGRIWKTFSWCERRNFWSQIHKRVLDWASIAWVIPAFAGKLRVRKLQPLRPRRDDLGSKK